MSAGGQNYTPLTRTMPKLRYAKTDYAKMTLSRIRLTKPVMRPEYGTVGIKLIG